MCELPYVWVLSFGVLFLNSAAADESQIPNRSGKVITLNDFEMYYEIHDNGKPLLLLLHGFSSSGREMWAPLTDRFADDYSLLIPDLRGHGRSTNPSRKFTHRQSAHDVFALLDHLKVDKVQAIGVSTGGMTLLHMATQQPNRVEAMVLVGSTHYFPESCRNVMAQSTVESLAKRDDPWGGYAELRKIHIHGDPQIRDLRQQFHGMKDSYDDMNFSPPLLGTIRARTLIVHGDRDPLFPVHIPVEMYEAISNAELWIVPNGGHVPIYNEQRFPSLTPAKHVPFVERTKTFFIGPIVGETDD